MPLAARVGDHHTCPLVTGGVPHNGGKILGPGSGNVFIGGLPAALVGDLLSCPGQNSISTGSSSVFINNKPAARSGDKTSHGGMITDGYAGVLIGG